MVFQDVFTLAIHRYKFDDCQVTPAASKEAIEDNYGGEDDLGHFGPLTRTRRYKRFTNAYLLVYLRECDLDKVLIDVKDTNIPKYLAKRLREDREAEEAERRERLRLHNSLNARVITNDTIKNHRGFDLFNFSNPNWPTSESITIPLTKDSTAGDFKSALTKAQQVISPDSFRVWSVAPRNNRTVRLDMLLVDSFGSQCHPELIYNLFSS